VLPQRAASEGPRWTAAMGLARLSATGVGAGEERRGKLVQVKET